MSTFTLNFRKVEFDQQDLLLEKIFTIYSQDLVTSQSFSHEKALIKARKDIETNLANPLQAFEYIVHLQRDTIIGFFWYCVKGKDAYIHFLFINENERNKGFAQEALLALEHKLKALGMKTISLHVFEHNLIAKHVYEKLGYTFQNANEQNGKVIGNILQKSI